MGTDHDGLTDEAWMHIGLRLPPKADVESLAPFHVRARPLMASLEIHGIQEGVRSTKQIPLVPPFLRAIRAQGGTPRFTVKLGTSDMTVVGPVWQCPILAYGPGDAVARPHAGGADRPRRISAGNRCPDGSAGCPCESRCDRSGSDC